MGQVAPPGLIFRVHKSYYRMSGVRLIRVAAFYCSMSNQKCTKCGIRRFENKAQYLRYLSEETGTDLDTLWQRYESQ